MYRSILGKPTTRPRGGARRLVTAVIALLLAGAAQTAAASPAATVRAEVSEPAVTIAGTGVIGTELTAVVTGVEQPAEILYQWSVNGSERFYETGPTYSVDGWDGGDLISVEVTVRRPDVSDVVVTAELAVPVTSELEVSYGYGDTWATNGETLSSAGPGTALSPFYIRSAFVADDGTVYPNPPIRVKAHVSDAGWLPEVDAGSVAVGSTAPGTELQALEMTGPGFPDGVYVLCARAYSEGFGWLGWHNGPWAWSQGPFGTVGYGYAIEKIQFLLIDGAHETCPTGDLSPYYDARMQSQISVSPHVQNIGWMAQVHGGVTAGTVGQGLGMEGLRLGLNTARDMDIEASAHVQNVGWQPYVAGGGLVGTEGQSLRMEALRIRLTGGWMSGYDVYYRVHVQNFGWLGWASNGDPAGTAGHGLRIEAVQVYIVATRDPAPPRSTAFYER